MQTTGRLGPPANRQTAMERSVPLNISPHEALIFTMITMSGVDREISDKELSRIGSIVQNLPVFEEFDVNELTMVASNCGNALGRDDGLNEVLTAIGAALPEKLRETAYALAVEIAITDRRIEAEEIRFLQMLRDRLGLEKLIVAAIERGARARHRKL